MIFGNTSITGHNYTSRKNLFGRLKELSIGDTFYIVSIDGRKITYEVKNMVSGVDPNDTSCIEQDNDGKRKVTLITCDKRRSHKTYS